MTVCIAAICDKGRSIVCVTDRKIDFGDFSADRIADKADMLDLDCQVLFAGNDSEYADSILAATRTKINGKQWAPSFVAQCVHESYHECLQEEITSRVLRRWGYTADSFLKNGRRQLTPEVFTSICTQITQVKISLQFLVCGFEKKRAHIYYVSGVNAPTSRDNPGMWAIGAGKHLALSSLAFASDKRGFSKGSPIGVAVYTVLEAKFIAESNGLVGRRTYLMALSPDKFRGIEHKYLQEIRAAWVRDGAPKVPDITKEIPGMFWGVKYKKGAKGKFSREVFRKATANP